MLLSEEEVKFQKKKPRRSKSLQTQLRTKKAIVKSQVKALLLIIHHSMVLETPLPIRRSIGKIRKWKVRMSLILRLKMGSKMVLVRRLERPEGLSKCSTLTRVKAVLMI